jgi:hypothetical protein
LRWLKKSHLRLSDLVWSRQCPHGHHIVHVEALIIGPSLVVGGIIIVGSRKGSYCGHLSQIWIIVSAIIKNTNVFITLNSFT